MTADPRLTAGEHAIGLTRRCLVFDCLALSYILEDKYAERCLAAGVNAVNLSVVTESGWDEAIDAFETSLERIEKSSYLRLALTGDDILAAQRDGRLAVILGTQGGAMVGDKLHRLRLLWRLGLRIVGLAYTFGNLYGDGGVEQRDAGLTFLGREFIAAANELPMLLDLSHCGHRTRAEAAELARYAVCTHSNAYALVANDRNTRDETAKRIVAKGGVMGICGLPKTVKAQNSSLTDLIDHCDHWVKLLGVQNVGVGLDFTEGYKEAGIILPTSVRARTYRPDIFGTVEEWHTMTYPRGIESISLLPNLTQELLDRGYAEEQIVLILGGNWMRVFRSVVG